MEKKNRKKKIRRVLVTGLAVIYMLRYYRNKRNKNRNRYTTSEKHEYYKFLD